MESVLESFARRYDLGKVEEDDLFGQHILVLDGAQLVESGGELLLCPDHYPDEAWDRCRQQMKQAGFKPQVIDDDSEEWRMDPASDVQVRVLFQVLGVLAAEDGPSQPMPRRYQNLELQAAARNRQRQTELPREREVRISQEALRLAGLHRRVAFAQ